MMKAHYLLPFLCIFFSFALGNNAASAQPKDTLSYIFLGHTYDWGATGNRVDPRLERIDWSQYDRIWLGGDICSEASLNYSTLAYINRLFDLRKPGNHWTLGNHDTRNGNLEWIKELTLRPRYYAHSERGITTVVLDGNISPLDCENLNKQYQLIKQVCDTIQSGHLIFLVHQGIYKNVPNVTNPSNYGHSELQNWIANCSDDSASYLEAVYPLLVHAKNKGVQVLHVMGDVGVNAKSYEGISTDGIHYLGSGINNSYNTFQGIPITAADLVLVFQHVVSSNQLSWKFVPLNDL